LDYQKRVVKVFVFQKRREKREKPPERNSVNCLTITLHS
jgi:hypothetical protein